MTTDQLRSNLGSVVTWVVTSLWSLNISVGTSHDGEAQGQGVEEGKETGTEERLRLGLLDLLNAMLTLLSLPSPLPDRSNRGRGQRRAKLLSG